MRISSGTDTRRAHRIVSPAGHDTAFRTKFSMYKTPPTSDITLDEFERFSHDRLKVLQEIDRARIRGKSGTDLTAVINGIAEKYLPLRHGHPEDIRKDVISHFVLRLAFCPPAQAKWFLKQEVALLRARLQAHGEDIPSFLRENDLHYDVLTPSEVEENKNDLKVVFGAKAFSDGTSFFKVPWQQALDLLSQRRVLLLRGSAILHQHQLVSIVTVHFRAHLSATLNLAYRVQPQFMADERISPFLKAWRTGYMTADYLFDGSKGAVDISQLDQMSRRQFPLCMLNLHQALRREHHLRHFGRMQYGLFLKGIGVTLEDALVFWEREFTRKPELDEKKFASQYAYNIRHNYGQEGKRANYSPYGCTKIIDQTPGVSEHHGCPFRRSSVDHLTSLMQLAGVPQQAMGDIMHLVRGHHYQIACKKVFDVTHPDHAFNDMHATTHPNKYFDQSRDYWSAKSKEADAKRAQQQKEVAAPQSSGPQTKKNDGRTPK